MKRLLLLSVSALSIAVSPLTAQFNADVDPSANWVGYMNVFELPSNGGGFMFGNGWAVDDLPATFSGGTLTLGPNTNTYDDNFNAGDPSSSDAYWINTATLAGNKSTEANFFVEDTGLRGQTVNFSGTVQSNTLTSDYTAIAIIKVLDADNGYSVAFSDTAALDVGNFALSLAVPAGTNYIPQYGFQVVGPNAPSGNSFGNVVITAVPEPSTWALIGGLATFIFVVTRRVRKNRA